MSFIIELLLAYSLSHSGSNQLDCVENTCEQMNSKLSGFFSPFPNQKCETFLSFMLQHLDEMSLQDKIFTRKCEITDCRHVN